MVINVGSTMVCSPDNWEKNILGGYNYVNILHQYGLANPDARWDAQQLGITEPLVGGADFPKFYVSTNFVTLSGATWLFRYARVLKSRVKIEWLGRLTEKQGQLRNVAPGSVQNYLSLEVAQFGTSLLAKMCHERYNRNRADNVDAAGLPPADMFGWNQAPIIDNPDMISTIDQRGTTPTGNLVTSPGVKTLRFTPERRTHYLTYKPLNRLDRAGATFDLAKLSAHGAQWDDNMRSGTLWLGQQDPLDDLIQISLGGNEPNIIRNAPHDYFRISYLNTIKFYGAARQGQDNGDL